jgi:hypothetical protein
LKNLIDIISENTALRKILDEDYYNGMLLLRLAFEQSKDEFTITLKSIFFDSQLGSGIRFYKNNPEKYIEKLLEF